MYTGAPTAVSTTCKMEYGNMSVTWKQPDSNGGKISAFKVYQRKGNEKKWEDIKTIEDNSSRKYVVSNLEKGEWYEFLVTATNEYGESLKKGSCARVEVPGGRYSILQLKFSNSSRLFEEKQRKSLLLTNVIVCEFLLLISQQVSYHLGITTLSIRDNFFYLL